MSSVEFTINVNGHNVHITSTPELENLDGRKTPSGWDMTGFAWTAKGEWDGGNENATVTVYWKAIEDDDAEGSAVDWENPWLIVPETNIEYYMEPNTGAVLRSDTDQEEIDKEQGLIQVFPNIPEEFGYKENFGNWVEA